MSKEVIERTKIAIKLLEEKNELIGYDASIGEFV